MNRQPFHLKPKRLVLILGTLGAAFAHAQDDRSRMADNAAVFGQALPSSSERERRDLQALPPSALAVRVRERVQVTEMPPALPIPPVPAVPAPPVRTVTASQALDGTNFDSGRAELLPRATAALDALAARLAGKDNVRIDVVGHTDSQRIAAWLKPTFPDNQALSEARARAVAAYLRQALGLPPSSVTAAGRGEREPVADNGTPQGMARNRRTEIRASYDETAVAVPARPAPPVPAATPAAPASVPVTRTVERSVERDACTPPAANVQPFSISVDGQPMDADTTQVEADRQRCVDVALARADIQVKYDPMTVAPALNVWSPALVAVRGRAFDFFSYTNYAYFLRRAEVRVFAATEGTRGQPLAVLPLPVGGGTAWTVPSGAPDRVQYVLRVYDADGRFDETAARFVSVADHAPAQPAAPLDAKGGWGESTLALSNIPAGGGTVTVSGTGIQPGQHVRTLGVEAPVDAGGRFALRQILPAGPHKVDVTVADEQGSGRTFSRNLSIADRDWFYVAMADITAGRDRTTGPAQLVTSDIQHYDGKTWVDGRGAFYLKGKIKGDTLLTASADTREQPLKDLFSNFASKDPNYLLRRIDPDRYYPVYGDDSTIADDAPTYGKLYVKLARQDASVLWGNFQTAWTGTELTQFNRGLYGANAQWASSDGVASGDRRHSVNVFAAEPGTLPMREEFRGTGGSLYYLHQQDLTQGSERLWIEVRDRDSGLVLERRALAPAQDYDINYLQGRVTLRTPLSSVSDSGSLFRTSGIAGNPAYLVATYEYVPGLSAVRGFASGVRAKSWLNDHVGVGLTAYHQGESASSQRLQGLDGALRYSANTWLNAEVARSSGVAGTILSSASGGFDTTALNSGGGRADAKRVQAAADLADLGARGRVTAYYQDRGAGFSGPGQITASGEAQRQHGAAVALPLGAATEVGVSADQRSAASQDVRTAEAALRHKLNPEWGVSAGMRTDERTRGTNTLLPTASPLLNQDGRRDDAVLRIDYRPLAAGPQPGAEGAMPAPAAASSSASTASSLMASATPAAGTGFSAGTAGQGGMRGLDPGAAAGVAGSELPGYRYADWRLYGFVQRTLSHTGDRSEADRAGVGGAWQASEKLQLRAEASGGSGGGGAQLAGSYRVNERSDVYLAYTLETERQDVNYGGREGVLTAGSHYRVNEGANLFAETRWQNGAGPQSLTHAFGVDLAPAPAWTVGMKVETGTLSDPLAGDIRRDAIGITAGYREGGVRATTGLEYRTDRTTTAILAGSACACGAPGAAATTGTRRSWLTRNALGWQVDPDWRVQGKLNVARSVASQGAFYDGDFTEFVAGAAYRPVANDRWNALLKYTYFYNLPASTQVASGADAVLGTTLDYRQRSHVLNADVTVDVLPGLSLGAKLGVRAGEVTASRTSTEWMGSRAALAVLRSDWHVVREWDGLAELRRLAVREARDARTGALVGMYRHVGQHAKIGVGYNFTNYSDDLTDLSYRSRGWFINALGTF
jgi:outer membrane protein OmpA-like peptidoglycan-associated protein